MNNTHLILCKVKSDKHRSEVPPPRAQSWRGNPHDEWLPHFPGRPRKAPGSFSSPSFLKPSPMSESFLTFFFLLIILLIILSSREWFVNRVKNNYNRRWHRHQKNSQPFDQQLQRSIYFGEKVAEVNIYLHSCRSIYFDGNFRGQYFLHNCRGQYT